MVRESSVHSVYLIDANDRVAWVNDAWRAFAAENGAPRLADGVIGTSLWPYLAGAEAEAMYRVLFDRVREGRTIVVPYRCDAPARMRRFELVLTPAAAGAVECATHVLGEWARPTVPLLDPAIARTDEFLHMCGWCKRVDLGEWVETDEAVRRLGLFEQASMPTITHGICPECTDRVMAQVG